MTNNLKKLTLSVATSALLINSAFALDPAITNFGYINEDVNGSGNLTIFDTFDPTKRKNIANVAGFSVAISPTVAWFYHTDDSSVTKYSAYNATADTTITTGGFPYGISLNSDGSIAYVSNESNNNISVINTNTNTIISTIAVGNRPQYITINPDNSKVYVSNSWSSSISVISTLDNTVINTINLTAGYSPKDIKVSPDGSKIYVVNSDSVGNSKVSVINTNTTSVIQDISVGSFSQSIVVNSDGSKLYVGSYNDGTISVIDTSTHNIIQTISGIVNPEDMSISPDGTKLYVVRSSNTLYVIDTTTYNIQTYNNMSTSSTGLLLSRSSFISPNLLTGTLEIASASQMLEKGFNNYVNFAGGTLKATGSFTLSNPVYLHDEFNLTWDDSSTFTTVAGGTVDTNGYDVTFSGEVSGPGSLTKIGNGVLTLSANNTYTGNTNVNAGLINFNSSNNFGTGNITLNGGGLQWANGNTTDISNKLNAIGTNGATFDTNGNNVTLASVLSGTGNITKTGSGVLTLSANNTYTGDINILAGTLKGDTSSIHGNISNSAMLEFAQVSDGTYSDILSGTGSLTKTGNGVLTLSANNTYTGNTNVNAGLINFNSSNNFGTGNITLNGGGLQWANGNTTDISNKLNAIGTNGATFDTNGNNVTLASVLSGTGNITKTGSGVLTLSANNTYTGDINILAGTLKGDTSSIHGNISNSAMLEFAQVSDGTYSDILSGTGSLTKTGNGVLTLSANNTYTGNTNVNGGTLAVTGDTSSSDFVVNNSGILSGNGTVGNTTVKNGGVIYPSGTSSLNVDGNLTFENGSIYRLNANRLAQSGKIAVSGTASLDGNVEVKADNNGTWNTSTNYEILSANSISGTFDGVSSDLAFLTPTLQYNQTGKVNLTLARNDVTNEDVINTTDYDKELLPVTKALDNAEQQNIPSMQDLFTVINGMNTAQAKDAYRQLLGTSLNNTHTISNSLSTFNTNLFNRLSRINSAGITGTNSGDEILIGSDNGKYNLWSRVLGGASKLNGDTLRSKVSSNSSGIQMGAEKISDDIVFGTSLAYIASDVNFKNDEAKSDMDTYILGLYAQKTFTNNVFVNADVNVGQNKNQTSRTTPTNKAFSDPKSNTISTNLEVGYKFDLSNNLYLKPSIIGGYTHLTQDAYSETGAGGANLSIDKYNTNSSNLGVSLKTQKVFTQNNKDFADVEFGIGYVEEFGDTNKALNATFASAPNSGNFEIRGVDKDTNKFIANISTNYYLSSTSSLFASVNGAKNSDEESINGILGVKIGF